MTYEQFITAIRSKLEDDGTRIADAPWSSRETWWPETTDFGQELLSDYGVPSSFPEIERAFNDEVGAIRDLIKEKVAGGTAETARQRVLMGLEHHTAALRSWDEIAIPVRRRGDLVFRILSPRDVMGGPIIQTLHVDHYIRGVSIKTAENAVCISVPIGDG